MRVLVANKFGYGRGGLERVMFDEMRWLAAQGHEVAFFTTRHPSNQPSEWSEFFAPYLELGEGSGLSMSQKLVAAKRMFDNPLAATCFSSLLDSFRPDIVHVHGIHRQLSPSIVEVAKQRSLPVVQTLHDYHHICPADTLLLNDGSVCSPRHCGTNWYGSAVSGRCVHGSLSASTLSAAETSWQRVRGVYTRCVERFVSPSRFMADQMRDGGWSIPTDIVPNAVESRSARGGLGGGFVVVGRAAREKGVHVALEAAKAAGQQVSVVGTGPLLEELRSAHPEATFTGHVEASEVERRMQSARAVVVPSLWFENASITVLEAMASGVPVIASAIGGIPEQVTDGVEGLLCTPGSVSSFADAMTRLASDDVLAGDIGAAGRARCASEFSPASHVAGLMAAYSSAVESA